MQGLRVQLGRNMLLAQRGRDSPGGSSSNIHFVIPQYLPEGHVVAQRLYIRNEGAITIPRTQADLNEKKGFPPPNTRTFFPQHQNLEHSDRTSHHDERRMACSLYRNHTDLVAAQEDVLVVVDD